MPQHCIVMMILRLILLVGLVAMSSGDQVYKKLYFNEKERSRLTQLQAVLQGSVADMNAMQENTRIGVRLVAVHDDVLMVKSCDRVLEFMRVDVVRRMFDRFHGSNVQWDWVDLQELDANTEIYIAKVQEKLKESWQVTFTRREDIIQWLSWSHSVKHRTILGDLEILGMMKTHFWVDPKKSMGTPWTWDEYSGAISDVEGMRLSALERIEGTWETLQKSDRGKEQRLVSARMELDRVTRELEEAHREHAELLSMIEDE
jgi:hypothetical protein